MIAGTLEIQLLANMARLQKDMDDAKASVGSAMKSIETAVGYAKTALVGFIGVASVDAFKTMIRGAVDLADNLNDLSKTTGLAVTQLAGLKLAAKQSGGDLEGIAASINKLSVAMGKESERFAKLGITAKDPLEAFKQLADVFSAIEDPQLRAALGAEALGKSWASAAPLLSEGSKNIADMVAKGTALSGVTQEMADRADQFNDRLAELEAVSGRAKMKLADEMLPAMTEITTAITAAYEESGKLQAVWVAIGALGAFAFTDQFSTATVKIEKLREELAELEEQKILADNAPFVGAIPRWLFGSSDVNGDIAKTRAAIADLQAQIDQPAKDATQRRADAEAKKAATAEAAEASRKASEFLKLEADAEKARAAALKAANEELKKQAAMVADLSGLSASFQEDWSRLTAMFKAGRLGLDDLTTLQAKLLAKQPAVKSAMDEQAKALADSAKLLDAAAKAASAYSDATAKDLAAMEESNKKLEEHNQEIGLGTQALNDLRLGRLDDALAVQEQVLSMMSLQNSSEQEIATMEQRIKLLKQQRDLVAQGQQKEAGVEQAKAVNAEWKRGWEETDRLARDAFVGWASEGKSAAEIIGDTLKKALLSAIYEATLKPVALQVYASVVGGGAPGADGSGSALGGLGNLAGMAGYFGSGGLMGAMMGGAGWMTGATTFGGSMAAAGSLMGTGTLAGGMAGAGMAAGAILPPVLIAAAALEIAKGLDGGHEYTTGSGIKGQFSSSGFVGSNYQSWKNDGDKVFGFSVGHSSSGTNYSAMDAKQVKSLGDAFTAINNRTAEFATALGQQAEPIKRFTKEITLSLGSDVAANQKAIADMFQGIADDAAKAVIGTNYSKEGESTAATLERLATSLSVVNGAFRDMGHELAALSAGSAQVASQLVDAFGGLDKYRQSVSSYLQNFYSQSERDAATRSNISSALASAGYTGALPTDRAAYRALVDEAAKLQNIDTEAGRKLYATLMGLNEAFASVTSASEDAQKALEKEAQAKASWQQKLDVLTGKTTERQIALQNDLAGVSDETTRTIIRQVYALQDAATAQAAYTQAVDEASQRLTSAQSAVASAASAVDSVRQQGTSAYLSALGEVAAAQERVASIQLTAQAEIARAANDAARAMGDLGKQLRNFIDGAALPPSAQFGKLLTAAMGGDKTAMQALPGAANSAIADAQTYATSAVDFALRKADIVSKVSSVAALAALAATQTVPTPAAADPMVAAQATLVDAQTRLADALTVANTIGAPLSASVTDLIGQYAAAQAQLSQSIAALAASQASLDAIKSNTASTVMGVDQLRQTVDINLAGKFDMLDRSLDELLSYDEYRQGFAGMASDATLQAIFRELDVNGDGQLSKLESIRNATAPLNDTFAGQIAQNTRAVSDKLDYVHSAIAYGDDMLARLLNTSNGMNGGLFVRFARGSGPYQDVYATGGAFTNGIVRKPTSFNESLMGEAGPEAIMPLVNIGGSLGVRAVGGTGGGWVSDLLAEMRATRAEIARFRAESSFENRVIAAHAANTADNTGRMDRNGVLVITDANEPLQVQVVA